MDQPNPLPVVPAPTPVPVAPQPRAKAPKWASFIGVLVPVACIAAYVAATGAVRVPDTFIEAYLLQISSLLLLVGFAPMFAGLLLQLSSLATSVGGFGVPSLLGLALSVIGWALIGRAAYALYHSRFRVVFWLITLAALGTLLWLAYTATAEFRALEEARRTGSTASCDQLEGEQKGYCLIEVAAKTNDETICDSIPGWQQQACYYRLSPEYSPPLGM